MSPNHFSTLSIAAAGLAALAVAGCGGDEQDGATTTAAAQAPAATAPAATTPSTTTAAPTQSGARDAVALAAATTNRQTGALAFVMQGTVTTKGLAVPLSARGTIDRKTQRAAFSTKMTFGSQTFTVQQIVDKRETYLRSPILAGKLPGGKSWMKLDLDKAARTPGVDLDALGVGGPSQDPAQGLDYLQGASTAKRLGAAEVNGVATTRYLVQVDLKRAAKRSAEATAKRSIDRLIATLGGPTTLPVDVWIDGDHLVRRQHVTYTATVAGQLSEFDVTTNYTDFDAKLDAEPPADGDAFDGLAAFKEAAKARQEAQQG
ncbi:MAG: hypothetical protein ABW167_17105 [Baekduia sp.]